MVCLALRGEVIFSRLTEANMPTPPTASVTEKRFADIVASLRSKPGVTAPSSDAAGGRRSFGLSGLKVNNKVFAMVSSRGEFVVKLPRQRVDALVASADGTRFDPGPGRLMKEWLAVSPTSKLDWLSLAKEALAFVGG
jgi:hypothetical protein